MNATINKIMAKLIAEFSLEPFDLVSVGSNSLELLGE